MHAVSPRDDQEGGARPDHHHHHHHHHPERGHDGDDHVNGDNDHDGFVDDCVLYFCISMKSFGSFKFTPSLSFFLQFTNTAVHTLTSRKNLHAVFVS